jgi:lipid-A-disaccharide synthase-like uncharacterized protein
MNEAWRVAFYPLGFIAMSFFFGRFFLQWIVSERHQECRVPKLFWTLSLAGNILLTVHSFIQVQYHVCAVQACNAVISWRNLNLKKEASAHFSFRAVLAFFLLSFCAVTTAFYIQGLFSGYSEWIRIPVMPWEKDSSSHVSIVWHMIGTVGIFLFALRFWIQWWHAEKYKSSSFNLLFWILSIVGTIASLCYFIRLGDIVHIMGYGVPLLPYVRNIQLMLKIKKVKAQ